MTATSDRPEVLRLGTRASTLARTQTASVAAALEETGMRTELVPMTSEGDHTRASLASLGGTGVFAARLRQALLAGQCDAVVHSLKDLPATDHPGLRIAATPPRGDARDVLCARDGLTVDTLPEGATVGTGSPRRAAQLRAHRPDLQVRDIRGNVETRLGYVTGAELDAVVLAGAGLQRVSRTEAISQYLPLADWPAAPGQGILAVEVREEDAELTAQLAAVHDPSAWACAQAERGVLARLEAGCAAPVAAYAEVAGDRVQLHAVAYHPHQAGDLHARGSSTLAEAAQLGARMAEELLAGGAGEWIPTR